MTVEQSGFIAQTRDVLVLSGRTVRSDDITLTVAPPVVIRLDGDPIFPLPLIPFGRSFVQFRGNVAR